MRKRRPRPLKVGDTIKCADNNDLFRVDKALHDDGIETILDRELTLRIISINERRKLKGYKGR